MNQRESPIAPERPLVLSGSWIVMTMVVFASLTTAALWVYWQLHTAPFVPLQRAIVAEFADSAPRVEGGQRKMHKDTPMLLRVVLKVDFDPHTQDARIEQMADRVVELARETIELEPYDQVDIHFFWPQPEDEIIERTVSKNLADETASSSERVELQSSLTGSAD